MSEVKNVHQPEGFRLVSRLKSFGHAGQGIAFMLRTQHNAWLHVLISVIVIALALYCGVAQVLNEVYGRTVFPLGAVK